MAVTLGTTLTNCATPWPDEDAMSASRLTSLAEDVTRSMLMSNLQPQEFFSLQETQYGIVKSELQASVAQCRNLQQYLDKISVPDTLCTAVRELNQALISAIDYATHSGCKIYDLMGSPGAHEKAVLTYRALVCSISNLNESLSCYDAEDWHGLNKEQKGDVLRAGMDPNALIDIFRSLSDQLKLWVCYVDVRDFAGLDRMEALIHRDARDIVFVAGRVQEAASIHTPSSDPRREFQNPVILLPSVFRRIDTQGNGHGSTAEQFPNRLDRRAPVGLLSPLDMISPDNLDRVSRDLIQFFERMPNEDGNGTTLQYILDLITHNARTSSSLARIGLYARLCQTLRRDCGSYLIYMETGEVMDGHDFIIQALSNMCDRVMNSITAGQCHLAICFRWLRFVSELYDLDLLPDVTVLQCIEIFVNWRNHLVPPSLHHLACLYQLLWFTGKKLDATEAGREAMSRYFRHIDTLSAWPKLLPAASSLLLHLIFMRENEWGLGRVERSLDQNLTYIITAIDLGESSTV
ncbi:hypothetical protein M406DRAFT_75048 [Cryphonectria parasitica EP155]|uniref:MIF4G domain-containing protein n=1 Tax=Cryphonectria parasitica (strain ATCC 38755 / EP155) TaxID=660469 RepID=A0A9P4XZD6_CRYP1|nr:uncharacterized protein M406DRAFT_75048 [Cryphonectria parasitica EP155]KAF3763813.1 hypothetical protein M406DRAFT_75048 [Cryphonectria parasitica EP155]